MGELTDNVPFDATLAVMQAHPESLEAFGAVSVTRSVADEQGGYLGNRTCV
jgi:hypothetical protein